MIGEASPLHFYEKAIKVKADVFAITLVDLVVASLSIVDGVVNQSGTSLL